MASQSTKPGTQIKMRRSLTGIAAGIIALFSLNILVSSGAIANELRVPIGESKAFVLDQPISTISITNPDVADVTVHNDKIILVIGRTFGTTNIIVLDADGKPTATKRVRVVSVVDAGNVTYVSGDGISSYSCAPRCELIQLPGDKKSGN